jgi:hypothetical protein
MAVSALSSFCMENNVINDGKDSELSNKEADKVSLGSWAVGRERWVLSLNDISSVGQDDWYKKLYLKKIIIFDLRIDLYWF